MLDTSTRPLYVVTDVGPALVKYIGNKAGNDSLICELVGSEIANLIGLQTPDFAITPLDAHQLYLHDFPTIQNGPAFFSRWEEAASLSPNSELLTKLRHPDQLALLVAFDTWLRNKDRYADPDDGGFVNQNFDNVLLKRDKRKVQLLVIDQTHAFVDTTLEDELIQGWADERTVYGCFKEFARYLTRQNVSAALERIRNVDGCDVYRICAGAPREWGMHRVLAERMCELILQRGNGLANWLPEVLFRQLELDL